MRTYKIGYFLKYPQLAYTWTLSGAYVWPDKPHNGGLIQKLCFKLAIFTLIYQNFGFLAYLFVPKQHWHCQKNMTAIYNGGGGCDVSVAVELSAVEKLGIFSETIGFLCVHFLGVCKMCTFYWYRPRISALMKEFEELLPTEEQQKGNDFQKLGYKIDVYARKSKYYMRIITLFCTFALIYYNGQPIIEVVYEWLVFRSDKVQYSFQTNTWYPWQGWQSYQDNEITFFGFLIAYYGLFTASMSTSGFTVGCIFLIYFFTIQLQIHLDYLATSLAGIDARDAKAALVQLQSLIKLHLRLLRLSKEINDIFNIIFLVNFAISAFVLCSFGVSMVVLDALTAFRLSVALCFFLIATLFTCYCCDTYTSACEKLHEALFNSNWYESSDPSYRKMILIFMTYTTRPNAFRAYKFTTVSMETYTAMLKFSYQLFTFFRTIF